MTTSAGGFTFGPAWLFCPADRPDRYVKATARADIVILDLEDAVAADAKAAARTALIAHPLDPDRTVVRLNAAGTTEHRLDLAALRDTRYRRVMLAKAEDAAQVAGLAALEVVALIESPLGALNMREIVAAPNVIGAMWGAEDLVAGLGGTSSRHPDGGYRAVSRHVRASMLLTAKALGKFALDAVYLDITDADGLAREAADAVASGFDAKVAIHPGQTPVIRAAYQPGVDEIEWAQAVLAAAGGAAGVFSFRGQMVDAPVLRHAGRILARSASPESPQ